MLRAQLNEAAVLTTTAANVERGQQDSPFMRAPIASTRMQSAPSSQESAPDSDRAQ